MRLQEYLKLKDLHIFSLKTLKGYSITKRGELSPKSFKRWMNWGMQLNGWYLTANFSEFPRTEKGCSLSEVLEEQVDPKYFLSEEITRLKNHLANFKSTIALKGEAGKKIDFIAQELHREINTIGSKASDFKISKNVIEIKSEIEKIREQAKNIE